MKKVIIPPVKSQGIKTKLVPWINDLIICSGIDRKSAVWFEPFFGTGVVGLNMGFDKVVAGDANPHIINFYKQLQEGKITGEILKQYLKDADERLKTAPQDGYEYYREVRDRFNKYFSPLDFIFLSRAGFNGMMRFNKKGEWNIPFCKKPNRFQQAYITKIVNQFLGVKDIINSNWEFHHAGFEKTILKATANDMIYCDPPYWGRSADFYNDWTEEDEKRLFYLLSGTEAKFILSTWHHNDYRENEMIKKLWSKFNIITKEHFYHAGGKVENRKSVIEALVCNFDVKKLSAK